MKHLEILALLLVTALAVPAIAQPGGAAAPPAGPQRAKVAPPGKGKAKGPNRKKRFAEIRRRLLRKRVGLSEKKAAAVEAIIAADASKRKKAHAQVVAARHALRKLFAADSDDQKAWAAALAELKSAHDQLAAIRNDEYAALAKRLTPKEQAKLLRAMQRVSRQLRKRQLRRRRMRQGRRGRPGRGRRGRRPPVRRRGPN